MSSVEWTRHRPPRIRVVVDLDDLKEAAVEWARNRAVVMGFPAGFGDAEVELGTEDPECICEATVLLPVESAT